MKKHKGIKKKPLKRKISKPKIKSERRLTLFGWIKRFAFGFQSEDKADEFLCQMNQSGIKGFSLIDFFKVVDKTYEL